MQPYWLSRLRQWLITAVASKYKLALNPTTFTPKGPCTHRRRENHQRKQELGSSGTEETLSRGTRTQIDQGPEQRPVMRPELRTHPPPSSLILGSVHALIMNN